MKSEFNFYCAVIWCLVLINISVYGISIDGQITVIKNDCYERMAIGERLSSKQTYKMFEHNTVMKCEMECTQEKDTCRAFSFGIGPKGNATCLLSKQPIKETADLKPIGTISDTDYDLYIKKMDCQIVFEPSQFHESQKPSNFGDRPAPPEVEEHHNEHEDHQSAYGNSPSQSYYHNSVTRPAQAPEDGYQNNHPNNQYPSQRPGQHNNDQHHVQALVSIASGPQSILHPYHDILVSGDSYSQGNPPHFKPSEYGYENHKDNMPPFRPPSLNHPYDNHRPQEPPRRPLQGEYGGYGSINSNRPRPEYGHEDQYYNSNRPIIEHPNDFNSPYSPDRPFHGYPTNDDRPDPDYGPRPPKIPASGYGYGYGGQLMIDRRKYESSNHYNSFETESYRYGPEHPKRHPPDYNYYDHYEKPNPHYPTRYGSVIPHPNDYARPDRLDPYYDYLFVRPNSEPYDSRPSRPSGTGYEKRKPLDENRNQGYDRPQRPLGGSYGPNKGDAKRPGSDYGSQKPVEENDHKQGYSGSSRPFFDKFNERPANSYDKPDSPKPTKRPVDSSTSSSRPPSTELSNHYSGVDYGNKQYGKPGEYLNVKGDGGNRKIVTQSVGYNGEQITSIITELRNSCFRRALAGKRAVRGLVRKLLVCDTVEQCQQECGDERQFTCEGFNYRLDPTGRGKGDCELLDLPLLRIDIVREVVPDPDYDYYTRDRNAGMGDCRQPPGDYYPDTSYGGGGGHGYGDRNDYHDDGYRQRPFDRRPTDITRPLQRPGDRWDTDYDVRRPLPPLVRPLPVDDRRPRPPLIDHRPPSPQDDRRYEYGNRRGDYSFHHSHESHSSHSHSFHYNEHNLDRYDHQHEDHRPLNGIHYLPASHDRVPYQDRPSRPYDNHTPPKRYPVIIPLDEIHHDNRLPPDNRYPIDRYPVDRYHSDRPPVKDHWGLNRNSWGSYGGYYGNFGHRDSYHGYGAQQNRYRPSENRRNYYIPSRLPRPELPKDWGLYGGSYGTGGYSLEYQGYGNKHSYNYWGLDREHGKGKPNLYGSDLLPPENPGNYLPHGRPPLGGGYPLLPRPSSHYLPAKPGLYDIDNTIIPAEPKRPPTYNFIRDECSLRSATGFRLHKGIVKKFFSVPNIYECEVLCVREKQFPCASYAYRYTINPYDPADNCFLSNRNYKELDYYTDLEPDRDFDIYTMNNRNRCEEPIINSEKKDSECFWRVRSGQRLDHSVVKDSLTVKSIVDCQLECLHSRRFTCRAYSFRYGSRIIGGVIDNCQLTDWPFFELDPRVHFVPEPGFEVYERGSYGHGCEPDHFGIRGKHIIRDNGIKVDQLCYIGFGSAAKLLPQATIKSLYVPTELDCKVECSKAREGTLFRCMSFSYTTIGHRDEHNCFLSDIMQRDLLPNIDFIHDPDSWLFAWDNYNPECIHLADKPLHQGLAGRETDHPKTYGYEYGNALDVWRVYSVSGWPCKRGTFCKENRVTGFWFCELEGGDKNAWDYCCSPDHQCGLSSGYSYSWCFVGPTRTQWRKCNDQYYPYIHNVLDRFDDDKRPWHTPESLPPPPHTSGYRPDRPNAPPAPVPPRPSLDEYEHDFDNEFLNPPKPGGFGQPRRWPVSYLHKEAPPNNTDTDTNTRSMRTKKKENSRLSAIKNLIEVIQNNDFKHVQYHIANDSNKPDDILYVKIPLPTLEEKSDKNITEEKPKRNNELSSNTRINLEVVDTVHQQSVRDQKSLPLHSKDRFQGNEKRSSTRRFEVVDNHEKQTANEQKSLPFETTRDFRGTNEMSNSRKFEVVDIGQLQVTNRQTSLSFQDRRDLKSINEWPTSGQFEEVDTAREHKSHSFEEKRERPSSVESFTRAPVYRRGFVTRTNLTDLRRYRR